LVLWRVHAVEDDERDEVGGGGSCLCEAISLKRGM
jgi:hypothetical protein